MFGDYDRGYQNYVPGAVNAGKTLVTMTAYNNSTQRRNLFNQTDATYFASTGGVKHTLLLGTELSTQATQNFRNTGFFNNTSTSILVPFADPLISTPVTFRQGATDANNHVMANVAAGLVQDQIQLTPRLQLLAGLRFDYFDLRFHNNRTQENLRRIDRLVSPRAGIVVKPVTALSLYASYGVSYLPSSGDQFSSLTTVTQLVKPESFTNYEVGAKWDARRNLTFTAALYRQDRTNTRSTDANDPARILQTGSQRTSGFEAGIDGSVTRSWTIAGGYSRQNAFITSATTAARAGARIPLVPHSTFSLWNKYQLMKRLGVGVGIISRADMFAGIDNTVMLPGYTRLDAAVYLPFAEKWGLQAHLENLSNRKYYLNADGNNNISPGSPRALRISLIARF
jgi:catecholate siderophore receptor